MTAAELPPDPFDAFVRDPAPCHDECVADLRAMFAKFDLDVHVQRAPFIVYAGGPYQPLLSRCPHGFLWISEPTGEQIARWHENGVA